MKYKLLLALIIITTLSFSQDTIPLPKPNLSDTISLLDAYKNRQSIRSFSGEELSDQTMSNLLWAANGVNRDSTGMRTAPSIMDWREVEILVLTKNGVFMYLPDDNALLQLSNEDKRSETGKQPFFDKAPLILIYLCNKDKMEGFSDEYKEYFSTIDSGFVSQNVYLFCAAHNLGTVIIGSIDGSFIHKNLELSESLHVIMAQPVGYEKQEFTEE